MTPTTRAVRLAAWVGMGLLIFYLVFLGGGWVGIYATQIRATSAVLVSVVAAAWAVAAVRDPFWLPRTKLWPAFAVALAAFALGLVLSRAPRLGVEYLAWSIVLVALYLLFVRLLAHDWFRPRVMAVIVFVTVLHGLAYLTQTLIDWVAWWDAVGRITTPPLRPKFGSLLLGNPSAVMTVQLLLTLASVAWIGFATRARASLSTLVLGLGAFAVLMSASRAGWLAVAAALAIVGGIWLASGERRSWILQKARSGTGRIAGVAAIVGASILAITLGPGILFRATEGGEGTRLAFYSASVRMFGAEPLHGMGPGMWPVLRATYTDPSQPNQYIPHAHNLVLHTVAEFGLVGIVAGLIAVGLLLRLVWPRLRDPDATVRAMAWASLGGGLYFGAHQLLDFYANMPTALFAFVVPIAFLDATRTREAARGSRSRWLALAGLLAVGISLGGLLRAEGIAARMDQAVNLANDGDWSAALEPAMRARDDDPDIPVYQFALATIARHNGRHDLAQEAYRRAAEADDFPAAWLGLAVEQQEAGQVAEARASLGRALRLGRFQPALNVAAADLLLRLGDEQAAIERFADAVAAMPSLAGDDAWAADPRLAPVRDRVVSAAWDGIDPWQGVWLGLALQDEDAASLSAARLGDPARTVADRLIRGWQGDRTALAELVDQNRAQPLDLGSVIPTATLADHLGEERLAAQLRTWADTVMAYSSGRATPVQFADANTPPDALVGQATNIFGHYTYRRPGPLDQIPAGLLHVAQQ